MPPLLALQLYLSIGLLYGAARVTRAEGLGLFTVVAMPIQRRAQMYSGALLLGSLLWPVGLVQDFRRGR